MTTDLSFESYLPVASFALAAAGLAVSLFVRPPPAKPKQILIAAILIFLLLASGILWRKDGEAKQQVRGVADEIIGVIGNEKRTYEEVLSGLRQPNYEVASAAIALLIKEQRIGSEDATITDKSDKQFRVRLYFVRTF